MSTDISLSEPASSGAACLAGGGSTSSSRSSLSESESTSAWLFSCFGVFELDVALRRRVGLLSSSSLKDDSEISSDVGVGSLLRRFRVLSDCPLDVRFADFDRRACGCALTGGASSDCDDSSSCSCRAYEQRAVFISIRVSINKQRRQLAKINAYGFVLDYFITLSFPMDMSLEKSFF